MKEVEKFVANHSMLESIKKFFNPTEPSSMLLDKKDIANVKAKLQREKRGNHPSANVVDQLQVVQSQLQSKPYLKRFIQRQGYAPCIILGKKILTIFQLKNFRMFCQIDVINSQKQKTISF